MAIPSLTTTTLSFLLVLLRPTALDAADQQQTHFHFFFHDITGGTPNITALRVASPSTPTPSIFGTITVMDDLLTEGPDPTSPEMGRAQGLYAGADQTQVAFLMAMNVLFTKGKYNGSVVTILGRNPPMDDVREMPVIGGSGMFRFARGYALAHTRTFDVSTGNAVVEYNLHVIH